VEIPAARPDEFNANCSGMQTPARDEQLRGAPVVATIQDTDEVSFKLSAPSASL
jgi:hypothetical protein